MIYKANPTNSQTVVLPFVTTRPAFCHPRPQAVARAWLILAFTSSTVTKSSVYFGGSGCFPLLSFLIDSCASSPCRLSFVIHRNVTLTVYSARPVIHLSQ